MALLPPFGKPDESRILEAVRYLIHLMPFQKQSLRMCLLNLTPKKPEGRNKFFHGILRGKIFIVGSHGISDAGANPGSH